MRRRRPSITPRDDLGAITASRRLDSDGTGSPVVTWQQQMAVDSLGQRTAVTDAAGATWSTSYDLAGRAVTTTDPADPGASVGRSQTAVYDLAGRQTRTLYHGPGGELVQTTGASFDADGNQTATISPGGFDAAGQRTSGYAVAIEHDGAGRATRSVQDVGADADGQPVAPVVEHYRFDAAGNLTGRRDGRDNLFTTSYQVWNLPEQVIEPDVTPAQDGTWTTRYDAGGLAVAETHPGGVEITRTFSPQVQTLEEAGTSPALLEPDATRTFGYDRAGRTVHLSHPAGTLELAYDGQGRLTTTSTPGQVASQRRYDPAGRMTGRRDGPSTGWTGFVYDTADRVVQVTTDGGAGNQAIEYLPDGRVAARRMAGKVQSFTYDALGREASNRLVNPGVLIDQVWFETATGYDGDGQTAQVEYRLPTLMPGSLLPIGANPAAGVHRYGHDQAGRTIWWTKPDGAREVYEWDGSHNRTRAGAATFAYDARNRITAGPAGMADGPQVPGAGLYAHTPRGTAVLAGSEVLLHDALGRQVFQTGLSTSYDGADRPAEVTVASGYLATVVDQLVDQVGSEGPSSPLGDLLGGDLDRLVGELGAGPVVDQLDATVAGLDLDGVLGQVLPGGTSGLVEGSGVFQMAYNGLELDPITDGVSDYTRMPGGQLATVDPDGAGLLAGQGWVGTNPHADVLWSLESSRGLASTAIYGPFGTRAGETAQPVGTGRAGFQGDWTDPISGQVHMGARWYRPASATFTARDTYQGELTNPVTRNRYLYGNGSPLRHWDLDGRCASDLGQARMVGTCRDMTEVHNRQKAQRTAAAAERGRESSGRRIMAAREQRESALREARSVSDLTQAAIDVSKRGPGHRFDRCRVDFNRRCARRGGPVSFGHVAGFFIGGAEGFIHTVDGVLATIGAVGSCAVDPRGCASNVSGFARYAVQHRGEVAAAVWDGLTADVRDAWNRGEYGEAAGHVAAFATEIYAGTATARTARAGRTAETAARGATGFARGEGVSALTANRLQHGTRHLSDAGVLPPWRGSSSPQVIRDALAPVLERPTAAFDHVLGGTRVRGFLGEVNGQQVALFVFKEGPHQGQLASSVIPNANQLAKWGVS